MQDIEKMWLFNRLRKRSRSKGLPAPDEAESMGCKENGEVD